MTELLSPNHNAGDFIRSITRRCYHGISSQALRKFHLSFSIQRDLVLLRFANYYTAMQGDLL
jgi:hypothetical protein